jgi:glycosyltransferase involved in cell wall biosynthesis
LTILSCEHLAGQMDQPAWRVNVLGMTREEFRGTHGRSIPDSVLNDHVVFLGRLESREAVMATMRDSTAFVLPSRETFGISFLEAISQCTPVVFLEGYAIDGLFDGTFVGSAAAMQSMEAVSTALEKAIVESGGVLGPFERNPVDRFSWARLAARYEETVLGTADVS